MILKKDNLIPLGISFPIVLKDVSIPVNFMKKNKMDAIKKLAENFTKEEKEIILNGLIEKSN